ncbi:MAG: hypothetical protein AAF998_09765 [Bacteroidota bacterium]
MNKLVRADHWGGWLLALVFFASGLSACGSQATNGAGDEATDESPVISEAGTPEIGEAKAKFAQFLANFPPITLPHEVNPEKPKRNALGESAQALAPGAVTQFLERETGQGYFYQAYGQYPIGEVIAVIFQQRKVGTDNYRYFVRTFSAEGKGYAEQAVAETSGDGTYTTLTYAKLTGPGEIRSQGYQSLAATGSLWRENYAVQLLESSGAISPGAVPPATQFLGRFRSSEPIDGDGGYDVWRFELFTPSGATEPQVALARCYENNEGSLVQCKEVGLVTDESQVDGRYRLILDGITGEMVPTYVIRPREGHAWTLAVRLYDVDSDSWVESELASQF